MTTQPNPESSKTPRTDAEAHIRTVTNFSSSYDLEEVYADFARQLETELAAVTNQTATLEMVLEATREDRDQLRQRVAELESGFRQLAQAVIDAHRKPGVGPAVPYRIAVRVLELLSTNQTEGGEPACPSLDPVIQETETYYIWKDTSSLPVEKLKYTIANLQNALNEAKRKLNEAVPIEIEEIIKQRDDAEYRATNLQNALNSANAQARVWETTANSYAETMRNIAKEVFGDAGLSNKVEFAEMVKEKFKQAENRLQMDGDEKNLLISDLTESCQIMQGQRDRAYSERDELRSALKYWKEIHPTIVTNYPGENSAKEK